MPEIAEAGLQAAVGIGRVILEAPAVAKEIVITTDDVRQAGAEVEVGAVAEGGGTEAVVIAPIHAAMIVNLVPSYLRS